MTVEFNIEGNRFSHHSWRWFDRSSQRNALPVPDDPNTFTSDRGWDLAEGGQRLMPIIDELELGIRVSLFMDPEPARFSVLRRLVLRN